ncbi:enoyl-CoA hydratase [Blastomyces gilchristii SLH14081]|uniref:Enoyl-CoA hydratase n=1 Tax=Blastomyces gilchristii (strain SLH14081) TaxID=559298 RepID=A0A179UNF0_BLAGS|nr:enoyl-CoA hydratase [Blastomyces gilchristii SLH14081]OAT09504.1 enoyl-CoA hydratase [Blastomyces gilchristii SLH14081]
MSSAAQEITVTYKDRVAIITLNRPKKLNALGGDHYWELGQKMREIAQRDDIFITVLTGTGRFFSAGADVQKTRPASGDADARREVLRGFVAGNLDLTNTFSNHPKILVVALNGPAVGLSAALTAFGDFIYAAPHTFLLTPFTSLGLVAEGGASHALVERLGISKANEALIMSKRIPIEDLVSTGYVNKVFTAPGGKEDAAGFLKLVLEEVEERLGTHLNQDSMVKVKELIRRPGRRVLDHQNVLEVFMGMDRFMAGIPQQEFMKIATGQKKHKL